MPPQLALLIYLLLILYLLWVDRKNTEGVSSAIWIPLIWFLLSGSRDISRWLDLGAPIPDNVYLEGRPVDRAVFLILLFAGAFILHQRRLNWRELFTQNRWMWLFFAFGAVSILWSDYPFVSFKRWNKALGNVIMVLIILTEQRPYEAIGIILRRFTYILIPLSVLFSKYYPHLGRAYHRNIQMFTGVTDHKNGLGQICLVSGIYFSWMLFLKCRDNDEMGPLQYSIYIMILLMTAWLLYMANSATSLVCMVVAVGLFVVGRRSFVAREPRKILAIGIASVMVFGVMEISFGFSETVIALFGRESDLTDRVPMWRNLLAMAKNPIIGFGFESFWLGNRLHIIKALWGPFVQAHNGYLQVYLDLGLIGLFLLVGWILSGFKKVTNILSVNYSEGMLRLCFILIVVLYNWTEATFYGVSLMWSVLLFGVMDIPSIEKEMI